MSWKKYILTQLLVIGFIGAFATAKGPNILIFNGDTISVYLNLLPDDFYEIDTVRFNSTEHINRTLNVSLFGDEQTCWTTGCFDVFQTTWEIENNQLYLTGINSCCYDRDSLKADLTLLFKEKVINGKVKADWISTKVIAQDWKDFLFYYSDYLIFRKEMELEFLEGKLLNINTLDNSKSRQSVYSQDATQLSNFIHTHIDWNNLPKIQKPFRVLVQFSANEDGNVDKIEIMRKSDNEIFNQEAVRVIKLIPDWDIVFYRGQLFRSRYNMPITFSEENREKYGK